MDKHSIHLSRPPSVPGEVEPLSPKAPSLFRNYISMVGGAIVIASFVSICLLFLIEITSSQENPYLGILTYILLPSIFLSVSSFSRPHHRHRRRHQQLPVTRLLSDARFERPQIRKAFFISTDRSVVS